MLSKRKKQPDRQTLIKYAMTTWNFFQSPTCLPHRATGLVGSFCSALLQEEEKGLIAWHHRISLLAALGPSNTIRSASPEADT